MIENGLHNSILIKENE